ncbi:hypothetical protein BsWGS_23782 [Bradybaena similaris]
MLRFVLILGLAVQCVVGDCQYGWIEHRGYCYMFSDHDLDYFTATAYCRVNGARLVQIDTSAKQSWIESQLSEFIITEAYIGADSLQHRGRYSWVPTGLLFNESFVNWHNNEPSNEDARAVIISRGNKWSSCYTSIRYKYICEKRSCFNPPWDAWY